MCSAVSRSICDVDKSDYMTFVNSVHWHCTILMKTTRIIEDILPGCPGRGVCDIRPECIKMQFEFEFFFIAAERKNWRFQRNNGVSRSF